MAKAKLTHIAFLILFAFTALNAQAQFDDMARFAFALSPEESKITVVDLMKQELAGTIELKTKTDSLAASENLRALIAVHQEARKLTLIDLTKPSLDQYDYELELSPDVVQVSPIGETVAIWDKKTGQLEVHAIRRNQVLASYTNVKATSAFTFNPDGSIIYWIDDTSGTLNSADLWSEKKQLKLAEAKTSLSALTRSVDGRLGFISESSKGRVHMIDLGEFRPLKMVSVGGTPTRPWGTSDGQFMMIPTIGDRPGLVTLSAFNGDIEYSTSSIADIQSVNPGWIDTLAAIPGAQGELAFVRILDGKELSKTSLSGSPAAAVVTSDSKTLAMPIPELGTIEFYDMREQEQIASISGLPKDMSELILAVSNNLCH